jgi:tetratricopeptide (TPR) repeat protein
VTRTLAVTLCLAAAIGAAAVAWQTAAREHEYRELLGRGEAALAARDTATAIEAYSGAIALHPDSMLAYLRRGETYRLQGDLDGAARDLRKAAELDPSATRPLESLGDVLYERGRYPQAAAAYERRLDLDDAAPAVAYRLALTKYRLREYDGALRQLDQVTAAGNTTADVLYLRGLCLRDAGDLEASVAALEEAVRQSPGMIPAREELAEIYGRLRRYSDELEHLRVIAGLERQSVDRQIAVGLALAKVAAAARSPESVRRNEDLAILTLSGALDRATDDPRIYGALGKVWLEIAVARDDAVALSKALEALSRAASDPSATSAVLTAYGRALARDGQLGAAERVLTRAMQRYPLDAEAFSVYAGVAEARGQFEGARLALVNYDALTSDDEGVERRARSIARLSLRLRDTGAAIEWLTRALQKSPDNEGLIVGLAEAYLLAGRTQDARTTITSALRGHPDSEMLRAFAKRAGIPPR